MANTSSVVTARLRRAAPVFVCKKCLGRVPDGKALRKALKSELKRRGSAAGTKPRVMLTSCLGICPKRAVVVASAATMARGEVLLLADAGAAVAEAAEKLLV